MEAKDTVIPVLSHSEGVACPHCGEEFGIESRIEEERIMQAEISFHAGRQEVVEWLNGRRLKDKDWRLPAFSITQSEWQAKLKGLGVEPAPPEKET